MQPVLSHPGWRLRSPKRHLPAFCWFGLVKAAPAKILWLAALAVFQPMLGSASPGGGIPYHEESRSAPRPLKIHVARIDLGQKGLQVAVAVGKDPDGDGPAEAELTDPKRLSGEGKLALAVNANAWGNLPPTPEGQAPEYVSGGASDMLGWVLADRGEHSPVESSVWSFWVDEEGRAHIGNLAEPVPARVAISGFGGLLSDGAIVPDEGGPLHPRTAVGVDRAGRMLTLVVVDGRQPGISEGMTGRELADLMQELGCHDALNLDGGGSSVFVRNGRILNSPSDKTGPRPVPVMLGVRKASNAHAQ